jgi:hypothetical protein
MALNRLRMGEHSFSQVVLDAPSTWGSIFALPCVGTDLTCQTVLRHVRLVPRGHIWRAFHER